MLANPAGAWGVSYATYRREWERANRGGLADATQHHSRTLSDGRKLYVARLPDADWQSWTEGTAPVSGAGGDLSEVIWAALEHQPPDGPAPWMQRWAQEIKSAR